MKRWNKLDWLILIGLVLIAAFLRLWRLNDVPLGFQFDEAYNASDALRVLAGERPLFFEANGGREALHIYWIAPFVAAFGATAFALRFASAIIGSVTVALSYVFWRRVLPHTDRAIAALASLLMAISYWHIHFSRYGIRAILMPLMLILTFYFLWSATESKTNREWVMARAAKNWRATAQAPIVPFALCGCCVGLALYAHPAARFIPVIVVLWIAWRAWVGHEHLLPSLAHFAPLPQGSLLRGLFVVAATAWIALLPLGLYFGSHPDSFFGHPTVVAITDPRVSEGNVVSAFAANMLGVAGMFFVSGDAAWIHNIPGRPVFDWALAIFFVIGLGVWAKKIWAREPVAVFLLIWIPIMLLPTLLSDAAPNFSRAIGILPALFVIPAWGFSHAYRVMRDRLAQLRITQYAVRFSFFLILFFSASLTFNDYFDKFPSHPQNYYAYDVDKVDAARDLIALAQTDRVYLPPLLAQHATFALLTRNTGFKSFDNGEASVLPARDGTHGMTYAFPAAADPIYVEYFAQTYGALAHQQTIADAQGKPLLIAYRIAAQDIPADPTALPATLPIAPQKIVNANFNDEMTFVGYRIAAPAASGKPYELTLVWQARQRIARDYTLFIHLDDANGKRIAQRDRRPGNGSYPTTVWSPGDIVVEVYDVPSKSASSAPFAPHQTGLQFAVGWYLPSDGTRARVFDAAGNALDDKVTFSAE